MTIAGGIMGALFHRERTGEATTVDVSLLGTGLWSVGAAVALSLQLDRGWTPPPVGNPTGNPLVSTYKTKDERHVALCCLQAAKYWPDACRVLGTPGPCGATSASPTPRRSVRTPRSRRRSSPKRSPSTRSRSGASVWPTSPGSGPSCRTRSRRRSTRRRWRTATSSSARRPTGTPFKLAAAPIQFGEEPPQAKRAPEFNEHGDAILEGLGLDWDTITDLKVRGVVA